MKIQKPHKISTFCGIPIVSELVPKEVEEFAKIVCQDYECK